MTYKEHSNDHDYFTGDHARQFLRNHGTGTDNKGRQYLGLICVTDYENPTVLDVACGTAVNWECWKGMGVKCQYTGLDLTQQFLDIAKEKYGDEIKLQRGFAQEITSLFPPESFDVVIIRHLLEHIHQGHYEDVVRQALAAAKREVIIVFFLQPHNNEADIIQERSSNIPDHPEVTHFWNEYSWPKLQNFFAEQGVRVNTRLVHTPNASHSDLVVRLIK